MANVGSTARANRVHRANTDRRWPALADSASLRSCLCSSVRLYLLISCLLISFSCLLISCLLHYDPPMALGQNIRDFVHGIAYSHYERELRKQANELNDLFLLLCYMEVVGLPNPATLYMLDIYPYLLDQFHLWHKRMGMDRSPLGNLPCC